jgi:cysteinyl-tRNA synthetase
VCDLDEQQVKSILKTYFRASNMFYMLELLDNGSTKEEMMTALKRIALEESNPHAYRKIARLKKNFQSDLNDSLPEAQASHSIRALIERYEKTLLYRSRHRKVFRLLESLNETPES